MIITGISYLCIKLGLVLVCIFFSNEMVYPRCLSFYWIQLQNDVISTYNCSNLLTFIDVGIYLFTKLHATVNFYIVWYVSTYENCKFLFIYFLFFRFWLLICCFVSYHKKKTFLLSCWCDYILVDLYSAAYVIMYLCFPITLIVTCLF